MMKEVYPLEKLSDAISISTLLKKTQQLKLKAENGVDVDKCENELNIIMQELRKTEWNRDFEGALAVLKEAASIPDPESPEDMLYLQGIDLQICLQEIFSPLNIAHYLLEKGVSEEEKVVVNGQEMTLRKMLDFFDFIAVKNMSIAESFLRDGKINDSKENWHFDPFSVLTNNSNGHETFPENLRLLQKALNLESKSKKQIVDGERENQDLYIEFDNIASKLVEKQYNRIDVEEDIEVMKVLARIPDPAAVCGEYHDRFDFFKEYPDGDFYIHMNSIIFQNLLLTMVTPLNVLMLEKSNDDSRIDFEPLKLYNPLLEQNPDGHDVITYLQQQESSKIEFATRYLRSFITLDNA